MIHNSVKEVVNNLYGCSSEKVIYCDVRHQEEVQYIYVKSYMTMDVPRACESEWMVKGLGFRV
jgi:hypothetical protein